MKFFATKRKPEEEAGEHGAGADPLHATVADPMASATGAAATAPGAGETDRTQRILRAIGATSGPADRPIQQPMPQTAAANTHAAAAAAQSEQQRTLTNAATRPVQPAGPAQQAPTQPAPALSGGAATIQFPARQDHPDLAATYDDAASSRLSQATVGGGYAQPEAGSMPSVRRSQEDDRAIGMVRAGESASALLGTTAAQQLEQSRPPVRQSAVVIHKNVSNIDQHDAAAQTAPVVMEPATVASAETAPDAVAQVTATQAAATQTSVSQTEAGTVFAEQALAQKQHEEISRPDVIGQPANDRVIEHAEAGQPQSQNEQTAPRSSAAQSEVQTAQARTTPAQTTQAQTTPAQTTQGQPSKVQPAPPARPQQEQTWSAAETPKGNDDPLLDCLVIMTAIFERPHSSDALSAGLPLVDDRLTPELFVRAAGRAGLSARIVRRGLADITNLSLPAVLLLKGGKACVLIKQERGKASVVLPETGQGVTQISAKKLESMFAGYVIFAKPEFQFDKRSEATEMRPTKDWFWGTLKKFWRIYAQVGVAALFVNLFAIATPLFVMNVYDRVVPTKGHETLWVLVVGVSVIFAFEFALRWLRSYFTDTAGRGADVIMSSMVFQQILGVKMSSKPASAGAFANQLREFETLRDFFTSATMVTLIDLPFIFLFITLIFIIGGPVAFVPLAAVPIVIGAGLVIQKPLTKVVTESARESAQKHALLVESIVGLETIKSMGAEGRTQRTWERFVGETSKSGMKARSLSQLAMFITTLTTQFTTIAVVVVGVYLIFGGDLTVGALIACTILTGRAMAPLGQVAALMTRFNQSMVSLKTLDQLMQMPVERPVGSQFVHRPSLQGSIEFKNVTFTYPNQQINALENVSFRVNPGEKIGIIGKIGSGKSTIERLALGLYQPNSGSIRIDGTDIQQIDPADLRRNIGYVSQDIFLFYGSVRENIAVGAPHADDAAILRAARLSGVDNFVSKHPQGFDLNVGERGENLSGGQRQSISLARAFVRNPNMLILDEPTSAMDKGSEDWFIARLREYMVNRSMILVTQRVSLLTLVDRLLVMDSGGVVADGPRDTVLEMLARGQIKGAGE